MRALALSLAALVLLHACAGPAVNTVELPPLELAAGWRTDAGPAVPVDEAWWSDFRDPALSAFVERAVANNTEIGIATARVRDARAQALAARSQLRPSLDLAEATARSRSVSPFLRPAEQTVSQLQFQAAYEIDLFGRLSDQADAGRSLYLASEAAREATKLSVAAAAANGYIALLALDARLVTARETLTAREAALRIARSRVAAGYSPTLELRQAEAEYHATAQLLPQIELAISRLESSLSQLVGETPRAVARSADFFMLDRPAVPDALPSDLLRRRPDVAQAEFQLAAADKTLAAARKRFLPQLRIGASTGRAFSSLLDDPISIWSLGGSVLAPLFEGGRLKAQAESAGAQRDQAAFAYRRAALTAFREVEDNLAAVVRLDEQYRDATAQRDAFASALVLATNRYNAGQSAYIEQLDAQRGLLNAELGVIQVRADEFNALVALYQAAGGGWSEQAPAN